MTPFPLFDMVLSGDDHPTKITQYGLLKFAIIWIRVGCCVSQHQNIEYAKPLNYIARITNKAQKLCSMIGVVFEEL